MALEQASDASEPGQMLNLATVLAAVAGVGLAFQVGHFAEHAVQFAVWILGDLSNICGRDTPWMSPWVTEIVRHAGTIMFPAADASRQPAHVHLPEGSRAVRRRARIAHLAVGPRDRQIRPG